MTVIVQHDAVQEIKTVVPFSETISYVDKQEEAISDQYAVESVRASPVVIAKSPQFLPGDNNVNVVFRSENRDGTLEPLLKTVGAEGVDLRPPKSAQVETAKAEAVRVGDSAGSTATTTTTTTTTTPSLSASTRTTTTTASTSTTSSTRKTPSTAPTSATTTPRRASSTTSYPIRRFYYVGDFGDEPSEPAAAGGADDAEVEEITASDESEDESTDVTKKKSLHKQSSDDGGDDDNVESVTMGEPLPPADLPTPKPVREAAEDGGGEENDWQDYQQHPPAWDLEEEEEEEEGEGGINVIVFDDRPSSFLTRKESVERLGEGGGMMVVVAPQKFTADTMVGTVFLGGRAKCKKKIS